jgi:hypothetical protein
VAIVLLIAGKTRPASKIEAALEVRRMAFESIQEDARDLNLALNVLSEGMKGIKENVARFMRNPIDVPTDKLLVPAALSMLRGLRSKKDHPYESGRSSSEE